jgi:hypothetical protein
LPLEGAVPDAMRLQRFLTLPAFEVLDVFLIIAFEPDNFRIAFER